MTFQFSAKFTLTNRKQQMELQTDDAERAAEVLLATAAFGQIFRIMRKIDNDGNTCRDRGRGSVG
jgi:hypothetical protein